MGKGYKGKDCAYCAGLNSSTTEDHVFARQFFLKRRRSNLPKVPACLSCNTQKSALEHYLTSVLPFGGRHSDALETLSSMVPRRLDRNRKLRDELAASRGQAWVKYSGLLMPTSTFNIDAKRLQELIRYIVRGLVAYHWGTVIPATYVVGVSVWTNEGERRAAVCLPNNGLAVAEASWGEGTFWYRGVQATDDPHLSIWKFRLYGGVTLGGDSHDGLEASSNIWAMTSKEPAFELFDY